MSMPTGKPRGRPPKLTLDQEQEIYELFRLRRSLTDKLLELRYGVTNSTLYDAVKREKRRRRP